MTYVAFVRIFVVYRVIDLFNNIKLQKSYDNIEIQKKKLIVLREILYLTLE